MSTPNTASQMKNKIDQDITSNQGVKKSITPTLLGTLLKIVVDWVEVRIDAFNTAINNMNSTINGLINTLTGRVTELENTEGQSVISFKKDNTITEEKIGLLAMHKKTPIVTTDFVVDVYATRILMVIENVEGEFAAEDIIEQGAATGTIISIVEDEGAYILVVNVTAGTFVTESPIIKQGEEEVTGDCISVAQPSSEFEVNDEVFLINTLTMLTIGNATISAIDGNSFALTVTDLIGDIEDAAGFFTVDEFDTPETFGFFNTETVTLPETSGGEDIATLCQTSPAIEGTKMEFELKVEGFVNIAERPTTKIMRINFNGDNIQDNQVIDLSEIGFGSLSVPIVFKNTPGSDNHVQIGATLSDTLDNFQAWLEDDELLNNFYGYAGRDGSTSIDIELLAGYVLAAPTWTIGSDDDKGWAAYRIDTEISGNLGDSGGGGYATYSVVRALGNAVLATTIANTNILGNIVTYSQSSPSQTLGFLKFGNIYIQGSPEEMGFVWFANGADYTDAVADALVLDSDFNSNFDLLTATWDSDEDMAVIRCRKKLSFNQNLNYSLSIATVNNAGNTASVSTVVLPTAYIPQMVTNMVLGQIVGIDGDDVLIDKSLLHSVTLAGEAEGLSLNLCDVLQSDAIIEELHAWDNGKVVMLGILSDIVYGDLEKLNAARRKVARIGGVFTPLTAGNGNIEGKEIVKVSRHTPYYTV